MPKVPHLPAQFLDPTGKDELEVRVPAADAFLAISAVASKTNECAFGDIRVGLQNTTLGCGMPHSGFAFTNESRFATCLSMHQYRRKGGPSVA